MSNISKNSGTNVGIELSSIAVTGENGGRGECWKFNISNQFPIIPSNIENGEVVLDVDSPHKGYSIQTVMEDGKMNGESRILNKKKIKVASLVFVDGIANGPCKLYDEEGSIVFEGYLKNGYREGKGREYDENGNVIFEGFYEQGKRMNIVEMKEMKGYWKEMNERNEIISICQKDDECRNDGICYFYVNGDIDRISEWKNGEEMNVLKRFEGKKMIEFVNGVKRYEGEYKDSIEHNYPREGKGEEYDTDGEGVIYQGQFENGKRQGQGKLYRNGDVVYDGKWLMGCRLNSIVLTSVITLIVTIALIVILFLLSFTMGIILLAIDIVFFLVLKKCYGSVLSRIKDIKNGKVQNSTIDDIQFDHMIYWILGGIAFSVIFALICTIIILISHNILQKQCLGFYSGTNLDIQSNACNDAFITSFIPASGLQSIEIGDDCFENVDIFKIDGLNELKSLKIGVDSFTHLKSDDSGWYGNRANTASRSFHILNCIKLKSIEICKSSFDDYGGEFELRNLPKLSTIKIGQIGSWSWNFFCSSFVIEGIIDIDIANK